MSDVPPPPPGSNPPGQQPSLGLPSTPPLAEDIITGSFFSRLFDMSFSRFVTPSIIQVLFILAIIVASVIALFMLIAGFATIGDGGILLVLLSPFFWILNIIYTRVLLELFIVFFRIERNTRTRP